MTDISLDQAQTLQAIRNGLDPRSGLPPPVFDFAYAILPMINVDLLAMTEGRFLLAWREEEFAAGWHIPGGIFRRCETIHDRIKATAAEELTASVEAPETPAAIAELFGERGHNISFLYPCRLTSSPAKRVVSETDKATRGDLRWFDTIPDDLYPAHRIYEDLILQLASGYEPGRPAMLSWRDVSGSR